MLGVNVSVALLSNGILIGPACKHQSDCSCICSHVQLPLLPVEVATQRPHGLGGRVGGGEEVSSIPIRQ